MYPHSKQDFAFWKVALEQVVAVNAALPPARSAGAWSVSAEHADWHWSEVPVAGARGRTEAVAAAVHSQQGGYRSFETRGGLPMPNAKVEARRNGKRMVALSIPKKTKGMKNRM